VQSPETEKAAKVILSASLAIAALLGISLLALRTLHRAPAETQDADDPALRQMQTQFTAAWAKSDARSIAALFAADADFIIPTGLVMRGQAEIEAFYSSVFAQGYGGSRAGSEILRIRFLRPDLGLVDATWTIQNVHKKDGSAAPDESGTLALVAAKTPQGWRIAALRESTSANSFHAFADMAKP